MVDSETNQSLDQSITSQSASHDMSDRQPKAIAYLDTSKAVTVAGVALSSLAKAVCRVSLCLSTRRLLHAEKGTNKITK